MCWTDNPKRVLIVRPSALGDVCRTVPALVTLRHTLPSARIDWLVNETFADAVVAHRDLNGVIKFPRDRFAAMWRRPWRLREAIAWSRRLRGPGYDLAIDLQGLFRSGLFTRLTRAPQRVGYANARETAHRAYNSGHHVDGNLHAVDRMLALLAAEGCQPQHDLRLYLADADAQWGERYLLQHIGEDEPFVTIAPTARWRCKCWPIDSYITIAKRLLDAGHLGRRIIALSAPDERANAQPLVDALGDRVLFPVTTVGQMMAVVSRASLLLCNDSAPLHVAVGFNRPIVTIFGPTDPALVGPYRRGETVVQPPGIDHMNLSRYRRHRDDQSLISRVSVEMVWDKLIEQVESRH